MGTARRNASWEAPCVCLRLRPADLMLGRDRNNLNVPVGFPISVLDTAMCSRLTSCEKLFGKEPRNSLLSDRYKFFKFVSSPTDDGIVPEHGQAINRHMLPFDDKCLVSNDVSDLSSGCG